MGDDDDLDDDVEEENPAEVIRQLEASKREPTVVKETIPDAPLFNKPSEKVNVDSDVQMKRSSILDEIKEKRLKPPSAPKAQPKETKEPPKQEKPAEVKETPQVKEVAKEETPVVKENRPEPPQMQTKTEETADAKQEEEKSVDELMREELGWQYSSATYIGGTMLLIALIGSYVWQVHYKWQFKEGGKKQ